LGEDFALHCALQDTETKAPAAWGQHCAFWDSKNTSGLSRTLIKFCEHRQENHMNDRIFITKTDFEKLRLLVERRSDGYSHDRPNLDKLEQELDRAEVVESHAIPKDTVTMNSEVRLRDMDSGHVTTYRVVFPSQVRSPKDMSVLAPIATGLLGYRAGSIVEWPVPKGIRRLKILAVLNQPSAEVAMLS
jgi:regulator of nucleoside diphosphate kinase